MRLSSRTSHVPQQAVSSGVTERKVRAPVHTKNSIRPEDYIIWRGKVMDLNRFEDRRPAMQDRFIGQVSK